MQKSYLYQNKPQSYKYSDRKKKQEVKLDEKHKKKQTGKPSDEKNLTVIHYLLANEMKLRKIKKDLRRENDV